MILNSLALYESTSLAFSNYRQACYFCTICHYIRRKFENSIFNILWHFIWEWVFLPYFTPDIPLYVDAPLNYNYSSFQYSKGQLAPSFAAIFSLNIKGVPNYHKLRHFYDLVLHGLVVTCPNCPLSFNEWKNINSRKADLFARIMDSACNYAILGFKMWPFCTHLQWCFEEGGWERDK